MPSISTYLFRRFGLIVSMYYLDTTEHSAPHIHIRYQEHSASLRLPDGEVLAGYLPPKQLRRVRAWMALNEEDLAER